MTAAIAQVVFFGNALPGAAPCSSFSILHLYSLQGESVYHLQPGDCALSPLLSRQSAVPTTL